MQQSRTTIDAQDTRMIPPVTPDEAASLASVELERFLALLETLTPHEWEAPTDCTLWTVRNVVSHVAGALTAYADTDLLAERSAPWLSGKADTPGAAMPVFIADITGMSQSCRDEYRDRGFNPLDALNQYQVDERAQATPAELMAELRTSGPLAIANRREMPEIVRGLQLAVAGVKAPVHYLTDVIYPRDMWMHRMEIALATGRPIIRTADHEGRLTALVVRDLARRLAGTLGDRAVVYSLTGPDGGAYRLGSEREPDSAISMDTVDFHLLASSRRGPEEVGADISGDRELARRALKQTTVTY